MVIPGKRFGGNENDPSMFLTQGDLLGQQRRNGGEVEGEQRHSRPVGFEQNKLVRLLQEASPHPMVETLNLSARQGFAQTGSQWRPDMLIKQECERRHPQASET